MPLSDKPNHSCKSNKYILFSLFSLLFTGCLWRVHAQYGNYILFIYLYTGMSTHIPVGIDILCIICDFVCVYPHHQSQIMVGLRNTAPINVLMLLQRFRQIVYTPNIHLTFLILTVNGICRMYSINPNDRQVEQSHPFCKLFLKMTPLFQAQCCSRGTTP